VTYQWQRGGVNIANAVGVTYELTQADVGEAITVVASYTDGEGTLESQASDPTDAVSNVNDDASGGVTITGVAKQGELLTASNDLADEDGLGEVTYQWQRGGVNIANAVGVTYELTQADVGEAITVVASYTDGEGTLESQASAATEAVVNSNQPPTVDVAEGVSIPRLVEAANGNPGVSTAMVALTLTDDVAATIDTAGWTQVATTTQWTRNGTYGIATLDTSTNQLTYNLDNSRTETQKLSATDAVKLDPFTIGVKDSEGMTDSTTINFQIEGRTDSIFYKAASEIPSTGTTMMALTIAPDRDISTLMFGIIRLPRMELIQR
jgi:VCBS repeat-containing protein